MRFLIFSFLTFISLSANAANNNLTWLAGDWRSSTQNGIFEEHWSQLIKNNMVGTSRLINSNNQPIFFELMSIDNNNKNIDLRIKHFGQNLVTQNNNALLYRLIQDTSNQLIFENIGNDPVKYIIYQHTSENTLLVSLKLRNNKIKESFEFTKL